MTFKQTIERYKLHHVLVWTIVFGIWYFLRYEDYSTQGKALTVTLIKTIDLAIMIYVSNYILVPRLLFKKRYVAFGLLFISTILISSIAKMYIIGSLLNNPALLNISGNIKGRLYDNVIPHFFLVTAGVAIKLMIDYLRLQTKLTEVAKEKAEAELDFLKSQINPHFLFNSLNAVYFLIDKNNTTARDALHKFSDMLRYQLYECNGDKIPIEKELHFLNDYVDMQKLRLNSNTSVKFDYSNDLKNFSIEPLLLMSFVENSFKHLSHYSNGKQNEVAIDITRKDGQMQFSVYNTIDDVKTTENKHEGIGLNNVKKRLQLLYPGEHELNITQKDDGFNVALKLSIN
ncbi:MAG: histidine kinase [Ginsengibacter sp.]